MTDNSLADGIGHEQHHYSELGFYRVADYKGPCERFTAEEAGAILAEVMDLTALPSRLPLPPTGLIGHFGEPDPEVMNIIRLGVKYLRATAAGERKTLWHIHERIAERLRAERWKGREVQSKLDIEALENHKELQRLPVVDERESFVYFIRSGTGPIKIGMAIDVEKRMRGLQTAHHAKLELLVTCGGGSEQESQYHRTFAEHRLKGEWFNPHPDILAEIDRLKEAA